MIELKKQSTEQKIAKDRSLYNGETPKEHVRKLGANRGKTRLWLEGKILSEANWRRGDAFNVIWADGTLHYVKNPQGARRVAGTVDRPIIDTNTDKLADCLNASTGEHVRVSVTSNGILIQK